MNGEIQLIFIRQNAMILTITIVSKHAVHIGLEILWRMLVPFGMARGGRPLQNSNLNSTVTNF